ncbi:toll-like receptor 13 [Acanthochromis polyacanthus]|uniref:toll-like receptor 13 n=1 Tax=Acanthochromis polyacanthus TaxID=80966 RepID=UPI002234BAA7|nr:toll-like receptor 13 [Acanthochromis polyacanthus]
MKTLLQRVNSSLTSLRMNAMKYNLAKLINMSCTIPTLSSLQLKYNKLKTVGSDLFKLCVNVTELELTKSNIKVIDDNAFRSLRSLKILTLSSNKLMSVPAATRNLPALLELDLSNNNITSLQCHDFTNQTKLRQLNLYLNSIPDLKDCLFKDLTRLQVLKLQSSHIQLFFPIQNLKSLYISRASLHSLDIFIGANLTNLEFLQRLVPPVGKKDNYTQVFDAYNYTCNYPPVVEGTKLLDLDVRDCSVDTGFICFVSTTCTVLCFMIATFTYDFMRWQLVYAYYLFMAWLLDTKHKNKQAPHQYDAFISYNTHDEPWVIRELLPKLEGEQGWKLCLHHRDFEPGKPIIDNITDGIYGSRKTICVISRRYLDSEWCSREIQAASFRLFDEQKDVLILVFLEEIPTYLLSPYHRMRKLLKRQTYLSWPQAGEHTEVFWEKLRKALKNKEDPDEDRFHLNLLEAP